MSVEKYNIIFVFLSDNVIVIFLFKIFIIYSYMMVIVGIDMLKYGGIFCDI